MFDARMMDRLADVAIAVIWCGGAWMVIEFMFLWCASRHFRRMREKDDLSMHEASEIDPRHGE